MKTLTLNGISVHKTFVVLNGVTGISPVSSYEEKYKDENGKKRVKRHTYFNLEFGTETTRFERIREEKEEARKENQHTLVIYTNEPLAKLREKILAKLKN